MDDCNKCCEINLVSLTYESLQVLPWNNEIIMGKVDAWKWCRHKTDFFQYMHAWKQRGIIISIYDMFLIQFLFCKNTISLKEWAAAMDNTLENTRSLQWTSWNNDVTSQIYSCKCSFGNNTQQKYNQIHCIHAIYGCKCFSKKYRIHINWEIVGCNYFREIKQHCALKKTITCN